jgi:hypothetical protein
LRALQTLFASIRAPKHIQRPRDISILSFSDASHRNENAYGQSGHVQFLSAAGWIVPIWWGSKKQSLVTYSSAGAEIVAASDCIDRSLQLQDILRDVLPSPRIETIILVDSNSLYTTLQTLHQNKDFRLRKVVTRIRDTYEERVICDLRWIPGKLNLADCLTKRNDALAGELDRVLRENTFSVQLQIAGQV